jgi:hypothetical protein
VALGRQVLEVVEEEHAVPEDAEALGESCGERDRVLGELDLLARDQLGFAGEKAPEGDPDLRLVGLLLNDLDLLLADDQAQGLADHRLEGLTALDSDHAELPDIAQVVHERCLAHARRTV